ncbi:MAG TPA: DNA polymerase III subunit gamma/tau, partial [Gammaproteobacteria bacterium]|nr:DNA polymerase III subunit gamma/tau [Gammaproteobacteria bacterium]
QEHVLRALINALDHNRLHHAFLFTGTRGVGKTTIARILAKSLNCETGVTSTPCGKCSACLEIDAGRFVDLIEVDAASRTGVDDTRELLDNVQYAPTRGRYKVYLIDEVHMLSKSAFNALLKTLEEPPPHVKFLLATTDPQKIPVTVLSRCLQFNLKRLPERLIGGRLTHIMEAEKIPFEAPAVGLLAHAADGSLRDALSLLDQAIAFGGGEVKDADVRSMLGTIERTHVRALLEAVAARNGAAALAAVARLDERAPDYALVLDDLAAMLQRVAVAQAVPQAAGEFDEAETIKALAARMDAADVQVCYQIALLGRRDLMLAPAPRAGFEMTLLRMLAFQPGEPAPAAVGSGNQTVRGGPSSPDVPVRSLGHSAASPMPAAQPDRHATGMSVNTPVSPPTTQAAQPWREPDWPRLVESLGLRGAGQQLAANCAYRRREGAILYLEIDPSHMHMATDQLTGRLEEALSRRYGETLKVRIQAGAGALLTPAVLDAQREAERLEAARNAIAADPRVRELCETFGTQVNPELVKPAE